SEPNFAYKPSTPAAICVLYAASPLPDSLPRSPCEKSSPLNKRKTSFRSPQTQSLAGPDEDNHPSSSPNCGKEITPGVQRSSRFIDPSISCMTLARATVSFRLKNPAIPDI